MGPAAAAATEALDDVDEVPAGSAALNGGGGRQADTAIVEVEGEGQAGGEERAPAGSAGSAALEGGGPARSAGVPDLVF